MRARSLKPSLFTNELLAVADPLYTVVFAGLWCMADKEGRLEDRPAKIHMALNPGRAFDGTCRALEWLADNGFIHRYQAEEAKYIQVLTFWKHQHPHQNEKPSAIPAREKVTSACNQGSKHFALTPSSLTPDSLNTAAGGNSAVTPCPKAQPPHPERPQPALRLHDSLPTDTWDEWLDFRRAKRWPNDATTLQKQLKVLAPFDRETQRQVLDTSMQAGWQGVFPPKGKAGETPRVRAKSVAELEAEEAARVHG